MGGLLWELPIGILCIATGGYILMDSAPALLSQTIALAIYPILEAIWEFVVRLKLLPFRGSGLVLFDGNVTLILSAVIWMTWPSSSASVVGTLAGISTLFNETSRRVL
jgi:uncharacterized membrane protein HdeD (DUF308 family)